MRNRLLSFAAVLAALGLVYLAAWRTAPAGTRPPRQANSQVAAVTSAVRACPPPGPGSRPGRIAMIAMPSGAGTGNAVLTPVTAITPAAGAPGRAHRAQPQQVSVSQPGALSLETAPGTAGTAVTADGAMAQGLEAEQASASGVSATICGSPGSDMWFVGAGQETAANIQLYLMNVGGLAASVDLTIVTDSGVAQGSLDTGITVPPHQFAVQSIAPFIHGSGVLALHLQTTAGQVAASVWEGPARGSGGFWLPRAAAPATRVVVPGLMAVSGAARLFVAVPGDTDAQVKVTAVTPHGSYQPFGSTALDAPAAAASSFTLNSLGGTTAAIELTSNVPVTAAMLVPANGIGAVTAAAGPVNEQGIVAGNPAAPGLATTLLLSAPGAAVRASVSTGRPAVSGQAASGQAASATQVVTVPRGHTVAVTIRPPRGTTPAFAVVITPLAGSGPLYAARLVTEGGAPAGTVMSVLPVPSAPTAVSVPQVRDAYTAIMP
ncbi:MAG: hypothetical protein JOY82_28450 [Streptosporangiaceae bacterium]|nr:hypothetical protein [Streptosporangiaceae bacterium]